MTAATILLLPLVVALAPGPDPADLVVRMGSARYSEREEAARALEALGRDALPHLRDARNSRDAEIRSRAEDLIDRIESALLTRPTRIALDFQDRPLSEVVRAIADRSGSPVTLDTATMPDLQQKRITLRSAEPVPFWEAIDRLCAAGGIAYHANGQAHVAGRVAFPLTFDHGGVAPGAICDRGPFRVHLMGLNFHRGVQFFRQPAGRPGAPAAGPGAGTGPGLVQPLINEQFTMSLQVLAEPRLLLAQAGPLKLAEAVDDRGQSLVPPTVQGAVQHVSGYYGYGGGPAVALTTELKRPEQPGRTIARLKGSVSLSVASRRPDPLIIPLADAAGKTFQGADAAITVQGPREDPNSHRTVIELTVRPLGGGSGSSFSSPGSVQSQFELADARGEILPWLASSLSMGPEEVRLTITPLGEAGAVPARLRYHELTRTVDEVTFEFRDVPLP